MSPETVNEAAVPLFVPEVGEEEVEAVCRVIRSKWFTMGPEIEAFEQEFAELVGCRHAVAVSNCTTALHLALRSLGVGPGDEVLVPALSFVATAAAVLHAGGVPVFVDIASETDLNLSLEDAAAKVTPRTRGLVVVHYGGYPADFKGARAFAEGNGLFCVEDAAHGLGAERDGLACGAWGDAACFSFYSTKNITTGEGGMLTTRHDDVAHRVRRLRSHALTADVHERDRGEKLGYDVTDLGYNYRMDELRAALGRVQLRRLHGGNARRRRATDRYRLSLAESTEVTLPFPDAPGLSSCHLMPVLLPRGTDREGVMTGLRGRGVQTSVHYPPIHRLTYYREYATDPLARTEAVGARELSLPLFSTLTDDQIDRTVEALRDELRDPQRQDR